MENTAIVITAIAVSATFLLAAFVQAAGLFYYAGKLTSKVTSLQSEVTEHKELPGRRAHGSGD